MRNKSLSFQNLLVNLIPIKMEKIIAQIMPILATELNQYYGNSYIFPLPDWAVLQAQPELVYLLPIYGENGIKIAKQRVDFSVDFFNYSSVLYYADFLFQQMDTTLEIIAYVVFYHKKIRINKHLDYRQELTKEERAEQLSFNNSQPKVEISVHFFNRNLYSIDDLLHWK